MNAQINFKKGYHEANPVPKNSSLSIREKIRIHQNYLKKAEAKGSQIEQIYGNVYLVYDYCLTMDYTRATQAILKAKAIADKSENPGWQGWVIHRKGNVSSALNKYEQALEEYKEAAALCERAKDSLCLAESLEQVSKTYGILKDFENALLYSQKALPLIQKLGSEIQLAVALDNLGETFSSHPGSVELSINYFEHSFELFTKNNRIKDAAKVNNDLAEAYIKLKQYDKALNLLIECMQINEKNQFLENLPDNYENLSQVYHLKAKPELAQVFIAKKKHLTDSLLGVEIRLKIADLENDYEVQKKELELEKSKFALHETKQMAERQLWLLVISLILALLALLRWWLKSQQAKKEKKDYQQNLDELTRLLLDKNTRILALESQNNNPIIKETTTSLIGDLDVDVFNQTILTEMDWLTFKSRFDKVYPGYLLRIRQVFPSITKAEERLFVFIKLNLNTQEAANILGISVSSVKKTRNRLRHKLGLAEEVSLEDFVSNFK